MKLINSKFTFTNIVLITCIYVQIVLGNSQLWHDERMIKYLMGVSGHSPEENLNIRPEKPTKEVDINNFISKLQNQGPYSPFYTYRTNSFPVSYYRKGLSDVLHTFKSNYFLKNSPDDRIQYEKRSVLSAVVRGNVNEYETLLKALHSLQSEKDMDVLHNNYDNGLKQVLEHLLPKLSPDKIDNIKKLLNSMIKRRFGSWGGRKRSEFYSWGGRKKRNEESGTDRENEKLVNYLSDSERTEKEQSDKEDMIKDGLYDDTTAKRDNDFYPWGGKRTVQPNFSVY